MSESGVDVIVVGVGTCGEDISLRLLGAGLGVVGIEGSLVGGECAYWACLPSKIMIRAANLLQETRRVEGKAGTAQATPDWGLMAGRLRAEVTGGWDDSYAVNRFETNGGRLIHGYGKLTGPHTVTVNGESITARKGIVIATGSKFIIPNIPGLADVDYWTTHDLMQAEVLPGSLLVLGGGAVGCELGQVMSRFGSNVTIIEAADRLMSAEEPEASAALEAAFEAEGISVQTGSAAANVESHDGQIVVTLADGTELSGERLLVAVGKTVDLSPLGLEAAGIDTRRTFIPVDEHMRAADGIWAMGDVTGKGLFTHVALYQSAIVAVDILGEPHEPANYDSVPRAAFTDPEVGSVGITEAQAREAGLDVIVTVKQLPATFKGWLYGVSHGIIKLVVDRETGLLLGASVVGPQAGEMLGFLQLAMQGKVPISKLRTMIYAFPTFYGAIGEAVGGYGRGLAVALDPSYEGFRDLDAVEQA